MANRSTNSPTDWRARFLAREHPCIQPHHEGEFFDVKIAARYYGPGYERGDWPQIRAVLVFLLENANDVWYGGDCGEGTEPADVVLAANDAHWLSAGYPYRWDRWGQDALPKEVDWPVDLYGKPMIRNGWGAGDFAAFHSPATQERIEYRNGEWSRPK